MENLRGAFALREAFPDTPPPGYLLVDDVFTTGSTVDECAKVLRKAGAGRVAVLTVMRG
jgi:predicted amidophosphoribosyltransferase